MTTCSATHLCAPEFHSPVERGCDEKVGKVDGAHGVVAADARHWPLVALEHLTDTCFTEVTRVDNS